MFTTGSLVKLKSLLASILGVDQSELTDMTIAQNELTPYLPSDKFSRMDIFVNVGGRQINVEMQCLHFSDFADRSLYYWAALFHGIGLKKGHDYGELEQTICINIVDTKMFDKPGYHSVFRLMDPETGHVLTDKIQIHFLELKKIEKLREHMDTSDTLKLWMQFLNVETEEELDMLSESGVPEISSAVTELRYLSADEQMRLNMIRRQAEIMDAYSFYAGAKREGMKEGREEGRAEGKAEGRAEGREEGKAEGMNTALQLMIESGMSEEEARRILHLD